MFPGLEQTTLIGDPSKPGPSAIRLKFPAGFKVGPHPIPIHARSPSFPVLGIPAMAIRPKLPISKSYPAKLLYRACERRSLCRNTGASLIQVSGTGPSGRKFVGPDAPN